MKVNAITSARLDYMTVKEYLSVKSIGIFLGVFLLFLVGMDMQEMAVGMFMMYGFLYSTYPFLITEKHNTQMLYATLPIRPKSLVQGRYLYAVSLSVASGLVAFVLPTALRGFVKEPMEVRVLLVTILTCFVIFTLMFAIQIPIYFKLDYSRAKMLAYLPILLVPAATFTATRFAPPELIDRVVAQVHHASAPMIAAAMAGWLGLMLISYGISVKAYMGREG